MVTANQVIEALRGRLPDIVNHLENVSETEHVTGYVISEVFDGLDYREQQDLLWGVLEQKLSAEQLKNVGPIATLTPTDAELGAMSTD